MIKINNILYVGDIVTLKSGGPKMTVSKIIGPDDISNGVPIVAMFALCIWFSECLLQQAIFDIETLNIID
jgi:uncharacterized protein YodC (DUF2158 family)